MKLIFGLLVGAIGLFGCRTTADDASQSKEVTPFSTTDVVDLTTYDDADKTVYDQMRNEMKTQGYDYNALLAPLQTKTLQGPMTMDEAVVLRLYTSNAYRKINKSLRTRDPGSLPNIAAIIKSAASGLNKIPAQPCTAKRGTHLDRKVFDEIKPTGRYKERAFMSTTYGDIPPAFKKEITFVIKSDTCRKIDWLSEFPKEKEVLFPPGSEFIVTKMDTQIVNGEGTGTIYMDHTLTADPNAVPVLMGMGAH